METVRNGGQIRIFLNSVQVCVHTSKFDTFERRKEKEDMDGMQKEGRNERRYGKGSGSHGVHRVVRSSGKDTAR